MGVLGTVGTRNVEFFYEPVRRHTQASELVSAFAAFPLVGISHSDYCFVGVRGCRP